MTTVATKAPELALSVAALTVISPHLAGVYNASINDDMVILQGKAEDVAHIPASLDLPFSKEYDTERGGHYVIHEGPAPAPFAAITVRVVAVSR